MRDHIAEIIELNAGGLCRTTATCCSTSDRPAACACCQYQEDQLQAGALRPIYCCRNPMDSFCRKMSKDEGEISSRRDINACGSVLWDFFDTHGGGSDLMFGNKSRVHRAMMVSM